MWKEIFQEGKNVIYVKKDKALEKGEMKGKIIFLFIYG